MNTRLFTALTLWCLSGALSAATDDPLILHEWGTFTSFQGADGVQLSWTPSIQTDLPDFVYSRAANSGLRNVTLRNSGGKGELSGFMRLETPVIYLYSQSARVIDVRVQFPNGIITEWYPQATRVAPYVPVSKSEAAEADRSLIEWKTIRILPHGTPEISAARLMRDRDHPQADHYYAARATDANFLATAASDPSEVEHERDLFYRGVGFTEAPLKVKLDGSESKLSIATRAAEPIAKLFVLTIRQERMRYQRIDPVQAKQGAVVAFATQPFSALAPARTQLMREVVAALVSSGLYAKEATAMVDTWKDQWFAEQGTRVLYILPRTWTDRTLPLDVSPRPDTLVRVMVGRAELLTPSRERELSEQLVAFNAGDPAMKRLAVAKARNLGLGRFFAPAIQKVLGPDPDAALVSSGSELARQASGPPNEPAIAQSAPRVGSSP